MGENIIGEGNYSPTTRKSNFFRHFCIFGLNIYLTTGRMRRRQSRDVFEPGRLSQKKSCVTRGFSTLRLLAGASAAEGSSSTRDWSFTTSLLGGVSLSTMATSETAGFSVTSATRRYTLIRSSSRRRSSKSQARSESRTCVNVTKCQQMLRRKNGEVFVCIYRHL